LVEQAESEKNFSAREFLGWSSTEQLEEVSSMEQLLGVVKIPERKIYSCLKLMWHISTIEIIKLPGGNPDNFSNPSE